MSWYLVWDIFYATYYLTIAGLLAYLTIGVLKLATKEDET